MAAAPTTAARPVVPASKLQDADARRRDLATIHIGRKALGLSDDEYRAMLWGQARVTSSAQLDHAGRARVLAHMRACGFKSAGGRTPYPGRPRAIHGDERSAQMQKVEALLADARRPWDYAHAMCKRMFKIERVDFATPADLQKLIAALVYDQQKRAAAAVAKGACA